MNLFFKVDILSIIEFIRDLVKTRGSVNLFTRPRWFGKSLNMDMRDMLSYYGVEESFGEIKEWYDGYHFGEIDVYCPWDVINQCDKLRSDENDDYIARLGRD